MRPRLLSCAALILLSGAVAGVFAGTGAARSSTPGDGCLVVNDGFGNVSINLSRGVIFGRVTSAFAITTDDTVPGDGSTVKVIGADERQVLPDGRVRYTSNSLAPMRFRTSGAVKIKVSQATQLDLSVVGKGTGWLSLGGFSPDLVGNDYSADAASFCQDKFLPIPAKPVKVPISSPDS